MAFWIWCFTINLILAQISKPCNCPSPLKLDFTIEEVPYVCSEYALAKKDAYSVAISDFRNIRYLIDIYLGSNRQKVTVSLDTGSFSLWVPKDLYSPETSYTSRGTGSQYSIQYVDGSGTSGKYYLDTISFSSPELEVPCFHFGRSKLAGGRGVLGIASRKRGAEKNSSLIWAMYESGKIPRASYSLFLGPSHGKGSIIFGAIDTKKFIPPLVKYNVTGLGLGSSIPVGSVTVNGQKLLQKGLYVLDSGTTYAFVSRELSEILDRTFNVTLKYGVRKVSCNQPSDKYIDFDFGNSIIRVPYNRAIVRTTHNSCWLGFSYKKGVQLLGDVFLRNAYVYYDYSENSISIAQASYSNMSNIVSVDSSFDKWNSEPGT